MVRSMGYEPAEMSRRLKLLFLVRLIPLAERNYNLVELGPRGTGKSYVVQEVSPYAALLTGGTTVGEPLRPHERPPEGHGADLGRRRLRRGGRPPEDAEGGHHDDEDLLRVGHLPARRRRRSSGDASIAMFGNTNQPIDVMVQTGHLFAPMPDVIRDDMAFIDRLHFYLPGWEIPKMRNDLFTDHYGFVVDYLAEALRELRKHNFTEIIDRHFSLGAHLNARDRKAVRKTVSGLMKILYPHGEVTQEELAEILELALEGRRRVKEQLKKMGSFEYYQTSFSYTMQETGEEQVRRRARAGRPRPHLRRPAGARHRLHGRRHVGRHGRPLPGGGLGLDRHRQAQAGRRRRRGDEGVGPAGLQLPAGQEERARHRARPRHLRPPRRGDRPARQPRRGRGRRRVLRRLPTPRSGRRR